MDKSRLCSLSWSSAPIVDVCTICADDGRLLVLTEDGALYGLSLNSGVRTLRCRVDLPDLAHGKDKETPYFGVPRHRLHASVDGRYAAIVVDHGQQGVVVWTATGEVTQRLDGGAYYEETVPFSVCFVRHGGRDVLIHRSAWNRLDASDPATGELLTARHITPYESGDTLPEHHLDYFHGKLLPSPDGYRLFDDGWVWHPIALPRAWSVTDWLDTNPWESEDGESIAKIVIRDDWNMPACWIDERHIALWGLADWNEEEFEETGQGPGVRISDVTTGPWPSAHKIPMDIEDKVSGLFSNGRHLYVAASTGTTVWDIATGSHLDAFDGFVARVHDRERGTLVSFTPDVITLMNVGP